MKVTESAPGPKPDCVVVANDPTSPLIVVVPVFVIPPPARTAKLSAVPRSTVDVAAIISPAKPRANTTANTVINEALLNFFVFKFMYINLLNYLFSSS